MPRMKSLNRTENRAAIANLSDLGFTVPAIAYMTRKSDANIYTLLKRMGRMSGRTVLRHDPTHMDPNAFQYTKRLFADPHCVLPHVWGVARTLSLVSNQMALPAPVKRGRKNGGA